MLQKTSDRVLAAMIYDGVRAGGSPAFPTWYRWGYGWKYGRGYEPITPEEEQQVQEKLAEYYQNHPSGYCAEKANK